MTNYLNPRRIKKSRAQVRDFIGGLNFKVRVCCTTYLRGNPLPPKLPIFYYIYRHDETGDEMRKKFIEDCTDDGTKSSTAVVKKSKVQNFDTTVKKRKIPAGDEVKEVKVQKDLLGSS